MLAVFVVRVAADRANAPMLDSFEGDLDQIDTVGVWLKGGFGGWVEVEVGSGEAQLSLS